MYVEFAEINRLKDTNNIYMLVHFWRTQSDADAGQPPMLTNDFVMQLRRTVDRIVTDAAGRLKRADGIFVAPGDVTTQDEQIGWTRETISRTRGEVFADVHANILGYARAAVAVRRTGDHTGNATKPLFEDGRLIPKGEQVLERDNVNDADGVLQLLRFYRGRREDVGE